MLRRAVVAVLFFSFAAAAQEDAGPAPVPEAPAKLDAKKLVAPKSTPELLEKGRLAFAANCVVCHGEKGAGDGPAGVMLNPRPRDFTKEPFKQGGKPAELFVTITEGVKDTPMVGWPQLTDEDRWALTYHVSSLAPQKTKGKGKAKSEAKPAAAAP